MCVKKLDTEIIISGIGYKMFVTRIQNNMLQLFNPYFYGNEPLPIGQWIVVKEENDGMIRSNGFSYRQGIHLFMRRIDANRRADVEIVTIMDYELNECAQWIVLPVQYADVIASGLDENEAPVIVARKIKIIQG